MLMLNKSIAMKFILFIIPTLLSALAFAKNNPIDIVEKLKNRLDQLNSSQVYTEIIKLKKTIRSDFEAQKKVKETTLDEIGILFDLQTVLTLIEVNDQKKINCKRLKNSLIVDYKEEWDEMPEGVKLIWPIIQKCCQ